MSDTFEHGVVKFFSKQRGFGFVCVTDERGCRTGEEIYFNIANGYLVKTEDWLEEPFFGERHGEMSGRRSVEVSAPRDGEGILFIRGGSLSRPKCVKWAHERSWNYQKRLIAELPKPRVVRVQNDEVVEVLWTSEHGGHQGVVELSKRFPRSRTGDDELSISYARCSSGDYPYRDLRIEVFAEDSNSRAPRGRRPMRWFPTWDNRAPAGTKFA